MSSASNGQFSGEPSQRMEEAVTFASGFLATTTIALPFFLYHLDRLSLFSAIAAALGATFVFGAIVLFQTYLASSTAD